MLQCKSPLMANLGLPGHRRATSGLPSASDIRAPKSALALISSALHPGADLLGGCAEGPNLTLSGRSLVCEIPLQPRLSEQDPKTDVALLDWSCFSVRAAQHGVDRRMTADLDRREKFEAKPFIKWNVVRVG